MGLTATLAAGIKPAERTLRGAARVLAPTVTGSVTARLRARCRCALRTVPAGTSGGLPKIEEVCKMQIAGFGPGWHGGLAGTLCLLKSCALDSAHTLFPALGWQRARSPGHGSRVASGLGLQGPRHHSPSLTSGYIYVYKYI